jgi:hypothetical protein
MPNGTMSFHDEIPEVQASFRATIWRHLTVNGPQSIASIARRLTLKVDYASDAIAALLKSGGVVELEKVDGEKVPRYQAQSRKPVTR